MRQKTMVVSSCILLLVVALLSIGSEKFFAKGGIVYKNIEAPVNYWVRDYLGPKPPISDLLKVFAIDEHTLSTTNNGNLTGEDWIVLVNTIAKANPKVIMIDKVFASLKAADPALLELVASIKVPIVTASYIFPSKLADRKVSDPSKARPLNEDQWTRQRINIPKQSGYIYGPNSYYDSLSRYQGRSEFDFDQILPIVADQNENLIFHWALFSRAENKASTISESSNTYSIPVNTEGTATFTLLPPGRANQMIKSASSLLRRARSGLPPTGINKGDIVYLATQFSTGETTFVPSPYGQLPASTIGISLLNTVLTNNWISAKNLLPLWYLVLSSILGAAIALFLSPIGCLSLLPVVSIVIAGASCYAFASLNVTVPWIGTLLYLNLTGVGLSIIRLVDQAVRLRHLKFALFGKIPASRLRELKNSMIIPLPSPIERTATVMFVDVVGFSQAAEELTPSETFQDLKLIMARVVQTVHEHDGWVNKSLGDGLLCYFGYDLITDQSSSNHADQALQCAVKIQQLSIQQILEQNQKNRPLLPIRIGLHTDKVFFGNLGDTKHLDLTIVGEGVNFASRLETACVPFRILLSRATFDHLDKAYARSHRFKSKLIQVKHKSNLKSVYELNPELPDEGLKSKAMLAYKNYRRKERLDQRHILPDGLGLILKTEYGDLTVKNFSYSGVFAESQTYFSKKVIIRVLEVLSNSASKSLVLTEVLAKISFSIEIRWSFPVENGLYHHGIKYVDMTRTEKTELFEAINAFSTVLPDINQAG